MNDKEHQVDTRKVDTWRSGACQRIFLVMSAQGLVGKAVSIQLLGGADTAGYVREDRPSPLLCHKGCISPSGQSSERALD